MWIFFSHMVRGRHRIVISIALRMGDELEIQMTFQGQLFEFLLDKLFYCCVEKFDNTETVGHFNYSLNMLKKKFLSWLFSSITTLFFFSSYQIDITEPDMKVRFALLIIFSFFQERWFENKILNQFNWFWELINKKNRLYSVTIHVVFKLPWEL